MNAEFQETILSQPVMLSSAVYQSLQVSPYFIYIFHRADIVEPAPKNMQQCETTAKTSVLQISVFKEFCKRLPQKKSQNILIKKKIPPETIQILLRKMCTV